MNDLDRFQNPVARIEDAAIEEAMAALRDAQPPAGLDTRLLARLNDLARENTGMVSDRPQPFAWLSLRAGAWACLPFAALLLLFAWHRLSPAPRSASGIAVNPPASSRPHQTRMAVAPIQNEVGPDRPALAKSDHPAGGRAKRFMFGTKPAGPAEATEIAASYLPSIAPPPPELTPQEKLLLRMARLGKPEELAGFDPALRAELAVEQHEDFDHFFPRPAPRPPVKLLEPADLRAPVAPLPPLNPLDQGVSR